VSAYYNEFDPYAAEWLRNLIAAGHIAPGDVDERSIEDVRKEDLRGYEQVHLFAGIGGWSLALRMAGWPDDQPVWTGSCPCQPFSVAGRGAGADDPRHLWPEMRRLIAECRPQVVFGEQVSSAEVVGTQLEAAFVVAVQAGDCARANRLAHRLARSKSLHYWRRWVDGVSTDLAELGYSWGHAVCGAHSVGAPHIRQRLWWCAERLGDACNTRLERRAGQRGDDGAQLATAERAGSHWGNTWLQCSDGTARRVEPSVPPLAYGLPRSVGDLRAGAPELGDSAGSALKDAKRFRKGDLRGAGNAIVPQVAALFIQAYREAAT
jgi:DNA (cytosine-5)-methyltransferase 1